jgi:hypothetical protein
MGMVKPWHLFVFLCTAGSLVALVVAVSMVVKRRK